MQGLGTMDCTRWSTVTQQGSWVTQATFQEKQVATQLTKRKECSLPANS